MITPSSSDIGRSVIYTPRHPGAPGEEGVITSFNEFAVFVRYGSDKASKGTDRKDLEWAVPKGQPMQAISDGPFT